MTMAERLRMEKKHAVNLDMTKFMYIIEEWFTTHDYDSWITVNNNTCYEQYPDLCIGTIRKQYSERYPEISFIGIPSEHLHEAINLLMDEGFYVYLVNEHEYKVSLKNIPFIHYGYNTWYQVKGRLQ